MARPLREQFALATIALFVPVIVVIGMTWDSAYWEQVNELEAESGRLAGAVAAYVDSLDAPDIAALERFVEKLPMPEGAGLSVVDESSGAEIFAHKPAEETVGETANGEGLPRTAPWQIIARLPTSIARDRTAPFYRKTVIIAGVVTLAMLAIEALFLGRLLRSLVHLEKAAGRVGEGDLSTPPREKMPARELEHLRDAFIAMVDSAREGREAIARQVVEERRMREEVVGLQQQIIRQERLAAIGVLLSGIAHELNNPLQAISGFAELLQRDPELSEDVRSDLGIIQKESRRASAIIRNLSRFGRQQTTDPVPVFLRDTVTSVVELRQRHLAEQSITLVVEDRATRPVMAVFAELQQVLLNFVINAEQALAGRPERRIAVRILDAGAVVRLEVEDTGPGVCPADESKLFQPFFTTKPVGEGTGLGLSVSYGIVRTYGGTIGYRTAASGGAVFSFDLPAAEGYAD